MYPDIDAEKTGRWIKRLIAAHSFSVKDIQEYLHLSCPQPIYRWFKGKALPSMDHIYALSTLLGIHMEEMIIPKLKDEFLYEIRFISKESDIERLCNYYERIRCAA